MRGPGLAPAPLVLAACCLFLAGCAGPGRLIERVASGPPVPVETDGARGTAGSPAPPVEAPASAPRAVVARPGDSLWSLARRWLGTGFRWPELARINHLDRPWVVAVGRRLALPGRTREPAVADPSGGADEAARYGWKALDNQAFTVGEKLTFAVQYGLITAGYATLSIPEVVVRHGRPAFHILAEARSLPFFDAFFTVRDVLDSYSDVDYAFSWGYEKHLREGGFRADAVYDYDQRRGLMLEPAKGTSTPLPPCAQDVLSCFYYFRTQPLTVGSVLSIPVTADDMKSYRLTVNVLRRERVKTLAGIFDCVVVQPHLSFKGVFRQKGQVTLWITDDRRRLPVLIRSKIVIGSININLQNAQWVKPVARGASDGQSQKSQP